MRRKVTPRHRSRRRYAPALLALIVWAGVSTATGQELEPRAYSPSPVGVTFFALGFSRSTGSIVFDPSLPITDVQATVNATLIGLGYTFPVLGRQALVTAQLPYVWGTVSGNVQEQRSSVDRSGLGNSRFKVSVNLHGSPAMTPSEFAKRKQTYIVAVSLTADAPTGQYAGAKLINIGTNRWDMKPEIGISYPVKKFDFDVYAGTWLYAANPDFFPGGQIRTQDPLPVLQGHISYTIRRRMWLALDATWYAGGATHINGGPGMQRQNSSRAGATFTLPIARNQSLKFAYSSGVTERLGARFRTLIIGWQHTHVPR